MPGLPSAATPYIAATVDAATTYGIPSQILQAVITKESRWNPNALGTSGEWGLGQLMEPVARALGVNRYDVNQNINGAAKLLKEEYDRFGNWYDALRAYNAGSPRATQDPNISKDYATAVLGYASDYGYSDAANNVVGAVTGAADITDPMTWLDRLIYGTQEQRDRLKGNPELISGQPIGGSGGVTSEQMNMNPLSQAFDKMVKWLTDHLIAIGVGVAAIGIILFSLWSLFSDPGQDIKNLSKVGALAAL